MSKIQNPTSNVRSPKSNVQRLNLPDFAYKVTKINEKPHVFDIIRRKYVMLTPEEWVRQHVLHWLINEHQYPKALIKIETGLQYQSLSKRTDLTVFDRSGKPFMLVECKAPSVKIDDSVLDQILRYNSVVEAPYLLLTNGLEHFVFRITENYEFENLSEIPKIR